MFTKTFRGTIDKDNIISHYKGHYILNSNANNIMDFLMPLDPDSKVDLRILIHWTNYFKKKNVPYVVIKFKDNSLMLYKKIANNLQLYAN